MRRQASVISLVVFILALQLAAPGWYVHAQLTQDEIDLDTFVIMPETLLYKIMRGEEDFVLVDVRSVEEFRAGHIVGARNLPFKDGTFEERRGELPRSKEIIFVSSDGLDALKALRVLQEDEYRGNYDSLRDMSSIEGGMGNWPYKEYLVRE
jgi:rhodanese-related sulfurtransferase